MFEGREQARDRWESFRPSVARSWGWIGGLAVVVTMLVVLPGCGVGADKTGRESASMPANPADRNDMYSVPPAMQIDAGKAYVATISTAKGDIVVQLDAGAAPQTVNNFVYLARQGFYDGLTFHRVEPGFVIQGGDPTGTGAGGPGYTVTAEIQLPHVEGAIAMARRGDEVNPTRASSGSQFYVTLAPTPFLDGAYTVFGQVSEGMDVVQSIAVGDVIEKIAIAEGS
jgi:cyclophilin family peptidyl-prolyl cis-trans isomerase